MRGTDGSNLSLHEQVFDQASLDRMLRLPDGPCEIILAGENPHRVRRCRREHRVKRTPKEGSSAQLESRRSGELHRRICDGVVASVTGLREDLLSSRVPGSPATLIRKYLNPKRPDAFSRVFTITTGTAA